MLVYRIIHRIFCQKLSASGMQGRWNSEGKKVIYCSESIPLAFLENMVRRQGIGFNHDFKIMIVNVPDDLKISVIKPSNLEEGWRDFKDYSKCQHLGDQWYDECETLILKVPSAVVPESSNYVINTTHPQFKKIRLAGVTDLAPDERIEDILKKYGH